MPRQAAHVSDIHHGPEANAALNAEIHVIDPGRRTMPTQRAAEAAGPFHITIDNGGIQIIICSIGRIGAAIKLLRVVNDRRIIVQVAEEPGIVARLDVLSEPSP